MTERALLSWSTGKDSAWTLHVLRAQPDVEVVGLLAVVDARSGRVRTHDVPAALLEAQAAAAGLPLVRVPLAEGAGNAAYEAALGEAFVAARAGGVDAVAYGDLFLEDVRRYREDLHARVGLAPRFPLWGRDTRALAAEMVAGGLRATLTCVDTRALDAGFAGRTFDAELLRDLPAGVDPCGERGELHTFAWAGPMFSAPIAARVGARSARGDFAYAALEPG